MQTHRQSIIEVIASVFIGFWVAVAANAVILPMYGLESNLQTNMEIGVIFTVISVARGYAVRRFFNWLFCSFLK